jgi:hypothetical protein
VYDKANPLLTETEKIDGRIFTKYVPEVAFRVCELIAEGKTHDEVFGPKNKGYTCKASTFFYWVLTHGECKRAFLAAQQISAYIMEDQALQAAKAIAEGPGSPQRVAAFRAYIDQLRWSSQKRNPTVFSDKAPVNVTVPIQINTGLDMGDGRGKEDPKVEGGENIYALEAKVIKEVAVTADEIVEAQERLVEPKKLIAGTAYALEHGRRANAASWAHKRKLTPKGPKKPRGTKA